MRGKVICFVLPKYWRCHSRPLDGGVVDAHVEKVSLRWIMFCCPFIRFPFLGRVFSTSRHWKMNKIGRTSIQIKSIAKLYERNHVRRQTNKLVFGVMYNRHQLCIILYTCTAIMNNACSFTVRARCTYYYTACLWLIFRFKIITQCDTND